MVKGSDRLQVVDYRFLLPSRCRRVSTCRRFSLARIGASHLLLRNKHPIRHGVLAIHPIGRSQPNRSPERPVLKGGRCPPTVAPFGRTAVATTRPAHPVWSEPAGETETMSQHRL